MSKRYFCPACMSELRHTQTDTINTTTEPSESLKWYRLHFECMTCPEILTITVDVPRKEDLPADCSGMPIRRHVQEVDNRDNTCTWLWLSETEFVDVDPQELYDNMKENCRVEED